MTKNIPNMTWNHQKVCLKTCLCHVSINAVSFSQECYKRQYWRLPIHKKTARSKSLLCYCQTRSLFCTSQMVRTSPRRIFFVLCLVRWFENLTFDINASKNWQCTMQWSLTILDLILSCLALATNVLRSIFSPPSFHQQLQNTVMVVRRMIIRKWWGNYEDVQDKMLFDLNFFGRKVCQRSYYSNAMWHYVAQKKTLYWYFSSSRLIYKT